MDIVGNTIVEHMVYKISLKMILSPYLLFLKGKSDFFKGLIS